MAARAAVLVMLLVKSFLMGSALLAWLTGGLSNYAGNAKESEKCTTASHQSPLVGYPCDNAVVEPDELLADDAAAAVNPNAEQQQQQLPTLLGRGLALGCVFSPHCPVAPFSTCCPTSTASALYTCVNSQIDTNNCGACGNRCPASAPKCCGGECVNLVTDDDNCGSCCRRCVNCELGFCDPYTEKNNNTSTLMSGRPIDDASETGNSKLD